jgi:hypothetical protein
LRQDGETVGVTPQIQLMFRSAITARQTT